MRCLNLSVLAACLAGSVVPVSSMEFTVSGDRLIASGEIREGDAGRFSALVATLPKNINGVPEVVISLSSPGGNLIEGIRLGVAIHGVRLPTVVERGNTCASSCAIAFLAGQTRGTTSDWVDRRLEIGAYLGFHGYFMSEDRLTIQNETLNQARALNGLIFKYASMVGNIDIGVLSDLLNTPPDDLEMIDTPREIKGLGIYIENGPIRHPPDWARNACTTAVLGIINPLDHIGIEERLEEEPVFLPTFEDFRSSLLHDIYPSASGENDEPIQAAIMSLGPSEGVDVLLGQPLYFQGRTLSVYRQQLRRGGGFYNDACYAIRVGPEITTAITNSSGTAIVQSLGWMGGFPLDRRLW